MARSRRRAAPQPAHEAFERTWIDAIDGVRSPSEVSQCREPDSLRRSAIGCAGRRGRSANQPNATARYRPPRTRRTRNDPQGSGVLREASFVVGCQHRRKPSADPAPVQRRRPHQRLETSRPSDHADGDGVLSGARWRRRRSTVAECTPASRQSEPGSDQRAHRTSSRLEGRPGQGERDAANALMTLQLGSRQVAIQRVPDPAHPGSEGLSPFPLGMRRTVSSICEVGVRHSVSCSRPLSARSQRRTGMRFRERQSRAGALQREVVRASQAVIFDGVSRRSAISLPSPNIVSPGDRIARPTTGSDSQRSYGTSASRVRVRWRVP